MVETLRDPNTTKNKLYLYKFAALLSAILLKNPDSIKAQTTLNRNITQSEIYSSNILDRIRQELSNKNINISIPNEYNEKLQNFVINDTIMKTRSATDYTIEFIKRKMDEDWGIDKEYQYLFIRSKIYGGMSQEKLYDRINDEDPERKAAYKKVWNYIKNCYDEYIKGFEIYMDTKIIEVSQESEEARAQSAEYDRQSAEYDRQSAEYDRQSAEYDRQSAEYDKQSAEILISSLENLARFYNRYKQDPNTIENYELKQWKETWDQVIKNCKNVDYKSILGEDIIKFYEETLNSMVNNK